MQRSWGFVHGMAPRSARNDNGRHHSALVIDLPSNEERLPISRLRRYIESDQAVCSAVRDLDLEVGQRRVNVGTDDVSYLLGVEQIMMKRRYFNSPFLILSGIRCCLYTNHHQTATAVRHRRNILDKLESAAWLVQAVGLLLEIELFRLVQTDDLVIGGAVMKYGENACSVRRNRHPMILRVPVWRLPAEECVATFPASGRFTNVRCTAVSAPLHPCSSRSGHDNVVSCANARQVRAQSASSGDVIAAASTLTEIADGSTEPLATSELRPPEWAAALDSVQQLIGVSGTPDPDRQKLPGARDGVDLSPDL
jgi:hypothetical protein